MVAFSALLISSFALLGAGCAGDLPRRSPGAEEMMRDEIDFLIS